jgi:hypothetical protein
MYRYVILIHFIIYFSGRMFSGADYIQPNEKGKFLIKYFILFFLSFKITDLLR